MNVFSATCLAVARQRRGLTQKALADLLGITKQTVSNYENDFSKPSSEMMLRIVEVLNYPEGFFYADDMDEIPSEASMTFRSLRSLSAIIRDKTRAAAWIAAARITPGITARFHTVPLDIPEASDETPELAAEHLREEWSLGYRPIPNLIHLLERKGVNIYFLKEKSSSVDAISFWRNDTPFIFLNNIKNEATKVGERGRFDMAHELGHLILHRRTMNADERVLESEADRFASAFLLPRDAFLADAPTTPLLTKFFPLKKKWKVSIQALVRRCKDLGVFTDNQYTYAYKQISMYGWRKAEPESLPLEESQLHGKIFTALAEQGTFSEQFADEIKISLGDLLELMPVAEKFLDPNLPKKEFIRGNLRLLTYE